MEELRSFESTMREAVVKGSFRHPRVLDLETTTRWLQRKKLTPQEKWLAKWSELIVLRAEQIRTHRANLKSPEWWADSPVVVGRSTTVREAEAKGEPPRQAAGWWLRLPKARFDVLMDIIETVGRGARSGGAPLRGLYFSRHQDVEVKALASSTSLKQLAHLSLACVAIDHEGSDSVGSPTVHSTDYHCINDREFTHLANSASLPSLRELDLTGNRLTIKSVRALASSKTINRLTSLNLSGNDQITGHGVLEIIASSKSFDELEVLDLSNGPRIAHKSRQKLPGLRSLERLDISRGYVRDGDLASFLASVSTPRLTHLIAARNPKLGVGCATAIAKDPDHSNLRVIDLEGSGIGDKGGQTVASSPYLTELRELRLADVGAGRATALAIAENKAMDELRVLDLSTSSSRPDRIGPEEAKALAESSHLSHLETLNLSFHPIGDEGALAIIRSPHVRSLERLVLIWTGATDKSIIALANASHMKGLRYLELRNKGVTLKGVRAIARATHLKNLYHLGILRSDHPDRAHHLLKQAPHLKGARIR